MSDRIAGGPILSRDRPGGRGRWLPLWSLQAVELIVAFAFVDISVHVGNSGLLVAVAAVLVALAVTAQGPLGIFRVCPPGLHLILVVAIAAVAAVAPVIPALRPDIEGIIVLEFGAVGLIRVATLTEASGSRRASSSLRGPDGVVIDAAVIENAVIENAVIDDSAIDATATVAGPRAAGRGPAAGPESDVAAPTSGDAAGAAARWAGRTAAAAAATGRQAVSRHRPEAEERVKRTIRNAGRLAGRFTAPSDSDKTDG